MQTRHIMVAPMHIKTPAVYVYGTHTVTTQGVSHTMTTDTMWEVRVKASENFAVRMLGIGVEILQDLAEDLGDRLAALNLKDRLIAWLRTIL